MVLVLSFPFQKKRSSPKQIPDLSRYQQYYIDQSQEYSTSSKLSADAASTATLRAPDSAGSDYLLGMRSQSLTAGRSKYMSSASAQSNSLKDQRRANSMVTNYSRKTPKSAGRSNSITVKTTEVKDMKGKTMSITRQTIRRLNGIEYVETTTTTTTTMDGSLENDDFHDFESDFTTAKKPGNGHPHHGFQMKSGNAMGIDDDIVEESGDEYADASEVILSPILSQLSPVNKAKTKAEEIGRPNGSSARRTASKGGKKPFPPAKKPNKIHFEELPAPSASHTGTKLKKPPKKMTDEEMYIHALEAARKKVYGDDHGKTALDTQNYKSKMSERMTLRESSDIEAAHAHRKERVEKPKRGNGVPTLRGLTPVFLSPHRKDSIRKVSTASHGTMDDTPTASGDEIPKEMLKSEKRKSFDLSWEETKKLYPFKFLSPVRKSYKGSKGDDAVAIPTYENNASPLREENDLSGGDNPKARNVFTLSQTKEGVFAIFARYKHKKDSSALDAVAKEVSSVESGNFKDAQSFHELPTEAKGFEGQEYSNTTNELLFEKSSLVASKRSGDEVMPESRKRSTGGGESTGLIFSSSGAISSTSSRSSTRLSNTLRGSSKEQKWRDPHPIPDVNDNRDTVSLQEGRAFRENTPLKDTASLKDGIGGKHISSFREPWSSKKLPELPNMDDSQFAEVKPVLGYEKDNAKQDAIDKGKNKDVNIHSDPSHSSKPQETVNNNKASSPGFAPMTESSSSKNRLQKKDANPDVNKLNMAAAPSVGSNETVSTARNKYHGGKEDELVGDSTGRALDTKESKRKALKMKSDGQKGFPYSLRGKKKMSKSHEKAVEEQQNYTVDSPAPKISILHSDSSSILSGGEQTSMNVDEMYDKALEMAMKKNHPQSRGNAPGNSIDQPKPFLAPFVSDNSSQTISDPSQSEMRLTSEATSDATVGRQDSTSVPPVPVPAPTLAPAVTAIRNHAFTAPPHILNAPFQQPQSPSPKRKASFFGRLVKFSQENYGYQPRRLSNNSKGKTQKVIQVSSPHLPSTPLVEPLHASEKETLNTEITPSSSVKTLTSIKKKFIFGKLFKSS